MSENHKRSSEVTDLRLFPAGMQRIAMGIEYRGDYFRGFQSQKTTASTVQAGLEDALSLVCDEPIQLVCAGRTDRGVHASNQIIHFDTLAQRPLRAWLRGVNTKLPAGISIRWAQSVSPIFHARFSAKARTYRYIIYNTPTPSALMDGFVTWDRRRLDVDAMIAASQYLVGQHDFSAFRGSGCQARSPVRCIEKITVTRWQNFIITEIKATAFLYHMVRNVMGV
ncbi:MAG: tRNA pseudouridine38-40 synthase, partial [Cellvibrionaceae bacterium]